MEEIEDNKKIEQQAEKPIGRAAILEMFKAANPSTQDEPDDESLFGFAHDRYSDLEGRHNSLNSANQRLAELVSKDPKLGAVLSMIAGENPKSFPYAVGRIYGKEPFDLEGDDLEEFESGYQANLKSLEGSKKNIDEYQTTLETYAKDNGLTEEQLEEVHQGVIKFAENLMVGIVPVELIDLIYKGINYDKDVQEAADTGFVEGKNEKIEARMKTSSGSQIPDLGTGNGSGAGIGNPRRKPKKKNSFFDEMKDVEV
ncbi:MAG: hypothetical protein LBQ73_00885 [Tannerellaceae bacterium]|nr:hypothetical protein [Tannerellaceae bacterium]